MTTHHFSVTHSRAPLTWRAERKLQIALGIIWLIDGSLQLQPFMAGRAFVTQIIAPNETDQPGFGAAPIKLMANFIETHIALFNLSAVTIQMLIGTNAPYLDQPVMRGLVAFELVMRREDGGWAPWRGRGAGPNVTSIVTSGFVAGVSVVTDATIVEIEGGQYA